MRSGVPALRRAAPFAAAALLLGLTAHAQIVISGTTAAASDSDIGPAGQTVSFDGGTLDSTATFSSTRPGTLDAGGGTFSPDTSTTLTWAGPIDGPGALAKAGGGTLILTGTNSYTSSTSLDDGTLRVGSATALPSGTSLRFNGGTLDLGANSVLAGNVDGSAGTIVLGGGTLTNLTGSANVFAGAITGSGTFEKQGAAPMAVSGANTFSGTVLVSAGLLRTDAANTLSSNAGVTVASGATLGLNDFSQTIAGLAGSGAVTLGSATLTLSQAADTTFGGVVSGTGALAKNGAGTLTLSGANTYTGNTTISAGTLQLGAGAATGSLTGSVSVAAGATLAYNRSDDFASSLDVSGAGGVTKLGAGNLTVTGTNTYTGLTQIVAGTFTPGSGSFPGGMGPVDISAGGSLIGTGLVVANLTGAGTVVVGGAGSLYVDNTGAAIFSGVITGAGALVKRQAGTLTLSGANDYTGGTTISAGTLQLGAGGNTGSLGSGAVQNDGALVFNRNDAVTFADAISGTGTLTQAGTGTLTLSGANTYTGATTVSAGTLHLGASGTLPTAGSLAIAGGATLDLDTFNQTLGGITGAGTLALGTGTLTVNAAGDSTFSGLVTGAGSLVKSGAGTFTLATDSLPLTGSLRLEGGTLAVTSATGVGISAGLVLDGGGLAFSGNFIELTGSLSVPSAGTIDATGDVRLLGSIGGGGILTKLGSGQLSIAGDASGLGEIDMGAGRLTATRSSPVLPKLNLGSGTSVSIGSGATSVMVNGLSGTGTVDVGGTLSAAFDAPPPSDGGPGGSGSSDPPDLTVHTPLYLTIHQDIDTTFSGTIVGVNRLAKDGTGTLTLTGANTFYEGVALRAGTLAISGDDALGYAGVADPNLSLVGNRVSFEGGTLRALNSLTTNRLAVFSGNGAIEVDPGAALTWNGEFNGTGTLDKTGAGTLIFGGPVALGGLNVQAGTAALTAGNQFAGLNQVTIAAGATLAATNLAQSFAQLNGAGTLALGTGALTIANGGSFSGTLNTTGGLTLTGGTFSLSGAKSYSGGTTVAGGTLQIDTDAALGAGSSALTLNGGTLRFGAAFDDLRTFTLGTGGATLDTNGFNVTYGQAISSSTGALTKSGTGTLTLSGANAYSGPTTLSAGTLRAGGTDAFGSSTVIVNAGTLDLNGLAIGNALDVRGGALTGLAGYTGTQTVSAGMNYHGTIGGALVIASGGNVNTTGAAFTGAIAVQTGGTLTGSGFIGGLATVASGGHLASGNSPGTLTFTKGLTLESGSILDFQLGTTSDLVTITGGTFTGPGIPGGIVLNLSDAGGFAAGTTYRLFNFLDGSTEDFAPTDFSLGTLIPGTLVTDYTLDLTSTSLTLTYNGSTSAIPEPSSYAAIFGIAALGLAGWRRRTANRRGRVNAASAV